MTLRACTFNECDRPSRSKGLCVGHYYQHRQGLDLRPLRSQITIDQRFWAKVHKTNDCWEWTSAVLKGGGYGQFGVDGRMLYAHRVAWEFANGPIPEGMELDHKCANRRCVRPDHLRVVTRSQNNQHRAVLPRNNTSGMRGVSWDKDNNAWRVRVVLNGRPYCGGRHSTLEAANAAAKALRAQLFTHDDHEEWLAKTYLGKH